MDINKKCNWLKPPVLLAIIFIISTGVKLFLNDIDENGSRDRPSNSASFAKSKNIFVSYVVAEPNTFNIDGKIIEFDDIWIEKRTILQHHFIWFSTYEDLGGFYLCFTLKKGKDVFRYSDNFFRLEDQQHSFGRVGLGLVFWETIPNPNINTLHVYFVKNPVTKATIKMQLKK